MKTSRVGRVALLLLAVVSLLGLSACVEEPPAPEPEPEPTGPQLTTDIPLTNLDPNATTTVRVTGTGFDADGGFGTRPPLAGMSTGVYLIYGAVADDWRPSEGAPGSAREVGLQRWPLPKASYDFTQTSPLFDSSRHQIVYMDITGTFVVDMEITPEDFANENVGIFTYGAGGVTKADQEIFIPITFADAPAA